MPYQNKLPDFPYQLRPAIRERCFCFQLTSIVSPPTHRVRTLSLLIRKMIYSSNLSSKKRKADEKQTSGQEKMIYFKDLCFIIILYS